METHRVLIRLPLVFCIITDFPQDKTIDCSLLYSPLNINESNITEYCYECSSPGRFILGGSLTNHGSIGHIICQVLWILTVIVGIFGVVSNIFIILVVRRRCQQKSFDFLLITLASFDLLTSVSAIISTTAKIAIFESWSLELPTLILYVIPAFLCVIGRSGSAYITVLITIERYVIIAHPVKCSTWFTSTRTKVYTTLAIILAFLFNIPRFSSVIFTYNHYGINVPSLRAMKWIMEVTRLEHFWYHTLKSIHYQIDIWLPFPLLLLFNVLLFIEIRKFAKKRQELTNRQKIDIRAANMFLPVVIVLFFCNIVPITLYILLHFKEIQYRELQVAFNFSMATNAAVNLLIYYYRSSFKEEIKSVIPKWMVFILENGNKTCEENDGNLRVRLDRMVERVSHDQNNISVATAANSFQVTMF